MKRIPMMLTFAGSLMALLPVASFAQCGAMAKHVAYSLQGASPQAHLQLASGEPQWRGGDSPADPIVGLWKMDFEDPADNYSDKGYSVWHSDHTEFLNSTRPPSVGAVCQGVWDRVGDATYRLNHFAMGYADGVHLTSVYRFKERVTVDRSGDHFSGTFSIEAYDPQTHASQGVYRGTVTGDRVKIDTGIDSQNF